ncbi:MAG TPA: hypothetical protein VF666_02475 [Pyrinomonadaceae bacterium]|jgi:hypothetical protein
MRHSPVIIASVLVVSFMSHGCKEQSRTTNTDSAANSNAVAQTNTASRPEDARTRPVSADNTNRRTDDNATTMSADENNRHKLFQAAGTTRNEKLIREVARKLGLFNPQNQPTEQYRPFVEQHMGWARENAAFIREMNTPKKATEYVNKHK